MKIWAIGYQSNDTYLLRGDNTEMIFTDYATLVQFMKLQEGEHKIYDMQTEGVIELFHGIVTKLDTHNGVHDIWLKEQWKIIV